MRPWFLDQLILGHEGTGKEVPSAIVQPMSFRVSSGENPRRLSDGTGSVNLGTRLHGGTDSLAREAGSDNLRTELLSNTHQVYWYGKFRLTPIYGRTVAPWRNRRLSARRGLFDTAWRFYPMIVWCPQVTLILNRLCLDATPTLAFSVRPNCPSQISVPTQ